MAKCLFVKLERHVSMIKNAIKQISSAINAYGRCVVEIWAKKNISQDEDALPLYT